MAAPVAWVGLDVGTSSAKCLVVRTDGTILHRASYSYPLLRGDGGVAEQDPGDYVRAAVELLQSIPSVIEVGGIGLSGQTPTLVFVDEVGECIGPAMSWQDTRPLAEATELATAMGAAEPLMGTELPWAPANLPAKLVWTSRNRPEQLRAARWLLQPKDFVGLWLTGEVVSDPWSSKGLVNVLTGEPVEALFDYCGLSTTIAPPVAPPWISRGSLLRDRAIATGLSPGIPISVGTSDALAAMLAIGAFNEPTAFVLVGSSDIAGCSSTRVVRAPGLFSVPETCAPLPVVYGPTQSSGAAVEWLSRAIGRSVPDTISLAAAAELDTPAFVPYLAGERAPLWRADVRAVLLGLDIRHGPAEIARGVLDGVAYSGRQVLEMAIDAVDVVPDHVRVGGAASGDKTWLKLRAGALGRPIRASLEPEVSALGAAMLGACARGELVGRAVDGLRGGYEDYAPDEAQVARAAAGMARYCRASSVSQQWAGSQDS